MSTELVTVLASALRWVPYGFEFTIYEEAFDEDLEDYVVMTTKNDYK